MKYQISNGIEAKDSNLETTSAHETRTVSMKVVLLLVAVFTANVAIGQVFSVAGKDVYLGVKAGWNSSKFSGDDEDIEGDTQRRKSGIHLGAVLDFQISDAFSVQPGLLFSQHGGVSVVKKGAGGTIIGANDKTKTTLNYLQIPIMAEYKIELKEKKGRTRKLALYAGPSIDFGLGGKISGGILNEGGAGEDIDVTFGSGEDDMFKPVGLRFGFGVGWLRNDKFQFNVGVMNRGIISIVDEANIKNNHFTVNGIWYFGKK